MRSFKVLTTSFRQASCAFRMHVADKRMQDSRIRLIIGMDSSKKGNPFFKELPLGCLLYTSYTPELPLKLTTYYCGMEGVGAWQVRNLAPTVICSEFEGHGLQI